jgi:thiamine phosphate synthase YjbQ (UPF0047 family)
MGDVSSTFVYRHTRLGILTEQSAELVDLTDGLGSLLTETAMETGYLNIQTLHAETGIVVVAAGSSTRPDHVGMTAGRPGLPERLDAVPPGLPERPDAVPPGLPERLDAVPPGLPERLDAVPPGLPERLDAVPPSACLRISDGRLQLGDAERVFLVERDGPAAREIAVVIVGEAWR